MTSGSRSHRIVRFSQRRCIAVLVLVGSLLISNQQSAANDDIVRGLIGIGSIIIQNEINRRSNQPPPRRKAPASPRNSAPAQTRPAEPRLTSDQVYALQVRLNALGHDAGAPDGGLGRNTRRAIRQWQSANGHAATGFLTSAQASALLSGSESTMAAASGREDMLLPSEVEQFQRRLNELGYDVGSPDGVAGPQTGRAIARFLRDRGYDPYAISTRGAYELALTGQAPAPHASPSAQGGVVAGRSIFGDDAGEGTSEQAGAGGGDAAAGGDRTSDPVPDPADYSLAGRDSPVDIEREIALRALATMPKLAENEDIVRRWFEADHPSPRFSSTGDRSEISLKYWNGTQFDKQDVLAAFGKELPSKAVHGAFRVTFTQSAALLGGFKEGSGFPLRFGGSRQFNPMEYRVYNRLLYHDVLMLFPNAPVIDRIPVVDPAAARELAARLADIRNTGNLTLRMLVTVRRVGPETVGAPGSVLANYAIRSDASLDGLALYGYSTSRKEEVELYRWDVSPRTTLASGGLGLAEAAAFARLPLVRDRLQAVAGNVSDDAWRRLLSMARLGAHPEILESDEEAFAYAALALNDAEKVALTQGEDVFSSYGGGLGALDEFARRKFMSRLRAGHLHQIRGRVPNLPFPVVEVFEGYIGEYDFDNEAFPLTFFDRSYDRASGYQPVVPTGRSPLDGFPDRLQLSPDRAEYLIGFLRNNHNDRRVHLAVFSSLGFVSDDAGTFGFTLQPEKIELFADRSLNNLIAGYEVGPLLRQGPAPEDPAVVAARLSVQAVLAKPLARLHELAALSRNYKPSQGYFEAFLESSYRFRQANEFDRAAVRSAIEKAILASLDPAKEIWLGGEISLGEYDIGRQAFPIVSASVSHLGSEIDSFGGTVGLSIYNPQAIAFFPMSPDDARLLVQEYPDRRFVVRQRVEPVGAGWDLNPSYPELNVVYRLDELYILDGEERDAESTSRIIGHILPERPSELDASAPRAPGAFAEREVLTQDMLHTIAARAVSDRLDDNTLDRMIASRFINDFEVKPSWPSRFFAEGAATPVRATRERYAEPFRRWLSSQTLDLPEKLTLVWERGNLRSVGSATDSSLLRVQCHHLTASPNFRDVPEEFDRPDFDQVFQTQVNEINQRSEADPLLVEPAYLEFAHQSAFGCADRGFGGEAHRVLQGEFNLDSDDGGQPIMLVRLDRLPMPPTYTTGNLAEIDVSLEGVEYVENGQGIPHILVRTRFEEVRFKEFQHGEGDDPATVTHLHTIGRDDTVQAAFVDRIGGPPDILGISVGQTLEEADAILKSHFDDPNVLDSAVEVEAHNQTFQHARIYIRQDGFEHVTLFRDPAPGRSGHVLAVARQVIAPAEALPVDGLLASVRAKFGVEDLSSQTPYQISLAWGDDVARVSRADNVTREATACEVRTGSGRPSYWTFDGQRTDHLARFVPWEQVRSYSFFQWPEIYHFPDAALAECGMYVRLDVVQREQTSFWMFVGDLGAYARGRAAQAETPAPAAVEESRPKIDIKL